MRVVGGRWRGQRLAEPRGRDVTRPTTDRVREACASMLDSALPGGIEGARVLDAFAGSGAMGIELLSRGAAHAEFIDCDRGAAALVRQNLTHVGADPARWHVTCADAFARAHAGRIGGGPFDVVVLDPPYAFEAARVAALLQDLAAHGLIASGGLALVEHAAADEGARPVGFEVLREKHYGICAVDLLRLEGTGTVTSDGAD